MIVSGYSSRKLCISLVFLCILGILAAENRFISATEAARKLNADLFWEPLSQEIMFTAVGHSVRCKVDSPLVFFDYTEPLVSEAPKSDKGQPFLPFTLFVYIENFFKRFNTGTLFRVGAILIDPGHGGKDSGAIGSYVENGKTIPVYEKKIALTVSLMLYEKLKHAYPDKKILLTRSGDTYPSLEDRVDMANKVALKKNEAILYISIHANANFNKRASGFEVWYLPPDYRRDLVDKNSASKEIVHILNSMLEEEFTTESILIAKNILDGLEGQIGKESKNRGLKEKEWFVVRNAKMPSVLIELGFVTNPKEAKLLDTQSYLQKCAQGIYNGLLSFITRFESS